MAAYIMLRLLLVLGLLLPTAIPMFGSSDPMFEASNWHFGLAAAAVGLAALYEATVEVAEAHKDDDALKQELSPEEKAELFLQQFDERVREREEARRDS